MKKLRTKAKNILEGFLAYSGGFYISVSRSAFTKKYKSKIN